MLLSIDRVLQLLAEGKDAGKIAEMSDVEIKDVYEIINNARKLLLDYNKERVKKRVIIEKTKSEENGIFTEKGVGAIFDGADLSAIPVDSSLIIYTDGASSGNPGHAGIGVAIEDEDGHRLGKVSSYIGKTTNNYAEYSAIIRALKIAVYFKTRSLKIRTDSELIVKQVSGEYKVKNENLRPLYDELMKLKKMVKNFKIEHITRNLNSEADYLAGKAVTDFRGKKD